VPLRATTRRSPLTPCCPSRLTSRSSSVARSRPVRSSSLTAAEGDVSVRVWPLDRSGWTVWLVNATRQPLAVRVSGTAPVYAQGCPRRPGSRCRGGRCARRRTARRDGDLPQLQAAGEAAVDAHHVVGLVQDERLHAGVVPAGPGLEEGGAARWRSRGIGAGVGGVLGRRESASTCRRGTRRPEDLGHRVAAPTTKTTAATPIAA
jgi:hypothetical protein